MSSRTGSLRRQRAALDAWLTRRGLAHTFSLAPFAVHRHTRELIARHAVGDVLDAGSGRSPYKRELVDRGLTVVSIDIENRAGETDVLADLQDMPAIASASMGTVLCTQVLEHVPRPWAALAEIARVLRPGGRLILSVPHLSAIHEAPHDYYRYTRYGLSALITGAGLRVLETREAGGLFAFLGHPLSMGLLCSVGAIPGLRQVAWAVNYVFLVRILEGIDRVAGMPGVFPSNYVVLAVKPDDG